MRMFKLKWITRSFLKRKFHCTADLLFYRFGFRRKVKIVYQDFLVWLNPNRKWNIRQWVATWFSYLSQWLKSGKKEKTKAIGKFKINEAIILFAEIFFSSGELWIGFWVRATKCGQIHSQIWTKFLVYAFSWFYHTQLFAEQQSTTQELIIPKCSLLGTRFVKLPDKIF